MSNNGRGEPIISHSFQSLFSGVTGSRILNHEKDNSENEEIKYCVDFGLHMGGNTTHSITSVEDFSNNYYLPDCKSIQFILLTHAHTDHEGLLPFLVRNGYRNPIYCTKATHSILYHALVDNQKCLVREHHPLYELTDVITTLSLIEDVEFNVPFYPIKKIEKGEEVNEERIQVTFFPNGHLLGSALIFVQEKNYLKDTINILFTGDYKRKNLFFSVTDLPKWIYKLPINIVIESTYGDKDSKDVKPGFKKYLMPAIERGGIVLIPVISLERTEIILYNLKRLQEENVLSEEIPIFLIGGGLAETYLKLYRQRKDIGINPEKQDFLPKNFQITSKESLNLKKQKIILATPGMMTGGVSLNIAKQLVTYKKNLILFTSYVVEGIGREYLETPQGEMIQYNGHSILKSAEVKACEEFSAHAKRDELVNFLAKFSDINLLIINHGDPEVKKKFAKNILKNRKIHAKDIQILSKGLTFTVCSSEESEPKALTVSDIWKIQHFPPRKRELKGSKKHNYQYKVNKKRRVRKRYSYSTMF